MSRYETFPIEVPATVTTGTAVRTIDLDQMWLQLTSTDWTGTAKIMVSLDGANFAEIAEQAFTGSPLSVVVEIPMTCSHVRIDTSAVSGGTAPIGVIAGRNALTL